MRETARVETVEETINDNELSYNGIEDDTKIDTNTIPPKTTNNSKSNTTYNPMVNEPDSDTIIPSY